MTRPSACASAAPAGRTAGPAGPDLGMDLLVGYVLQAGVLLSVLLLMAGVLWQWRVSGRLGLDYPLVGENLFRFVLTDLRQLLGGRLRPALVVNTGVIVLMLTPFIRVAASVLFFLLVERNLKYAAFTTFVLVVLTYSLFLR